MDIPRAWLGEQGMLKFMESLSDLKLEDEGNSGETKRIPEENDTEKERGETKGERRKEKKMAIERCDKCGKAFMSHSEVDRHKMYEHPVPVSPFEEGRFGSDTSRNNSNMNMEDLQKMTSDVTTTTNGKSNSNNDMTTIDGGQMRKVPFRLFRVLKKDRWSFL